MKKRYSKPEILFESFSMNCSIAAGCEVISCAPDNECPVTVPDPGWEGVTIFIENSTCAFSAPPNDSVCYHVPQESWNVYSS